MGSKYALDTLSLTMPARPVSSKILSENGKPGKKSSKEKEVVPVYDPDAPEPTCRAELTKYRISLTFDDKTANKMLWISDGGSKVCRRVEEVCPVLDRPERYEGAARRADSGPSGLGENEESWGLCWSGTCYEVWFNGVSKEIKDVPFCPIIGVYIDQPVGVICFYMVKGEGEEKEATLLYRFQTPIEKKIFPGFWIGIQSACTLLKKPL